jgi:hypothetical protein
MEAIPVPYELREYVVNTSAFQEQLADLGWQLHCARSPYQDPQVFRQPWLVCPTGAVYPERHLYKFLLQTSCRKSLASLLSRLPCRRSRLYEQCSADLLNGKFFSFLLDEQWFSWEGDWLVRGPMQADIQDLGHTLEWLVAEWLRLTLTLCRQRLIQVRHGVYLANCPVPGDVDVLACLDGGLLLVECKSCTKVEDIHLDRFIERALLIRPLAAILLIDTIPPLSRERVEQCRHALRRRQAAPLQGGGSLYWTADRIYLTNTSENLGSTLELVLKHVLPE